MAEPMQVEVPVTRPPRGTPEHLRQFGQLYGCGRKKMRALAAAFPNVEDLEAATQEDFRKVPGIKMAMADKLFAIRGLPADQVIHNGEVRVTVWNKTTQRKISGAAAPKESELDAWLARHPDTHERYAGQDEQIQGPDMVPPGCQMTEAAFKAHWTNDPRLDSANIAINHVPGVVDRYGLRPLALPQAESAAGSLPEGGTLHFALLHAAKLIDGDVDALHCMLEQQGSPSELSPLPMLNAARELLRRDVWVWTSAEPAGVFLCEGEEEMDPTQVTPLRVCQLGGYFFALTRTEDCDEVSVTLTPLAGGATAEAELQHELPDLKEAVNIGLADIESQIKAISKWSKAHLNEEYDVSAAEKSVEELRKRLVNGNGMCAAFIGNNGVGKSTICNLLILNSSIDDETYRKGPGDDYVPEALLNLPMKQRAPTHAQLVENKTEVVIDDLTVTILPSSEEEAKEAASQYRATENEIKMYCESGGNRPQLTNFVLPSGDPASSTTALHTRVHYGSVVHLLVEYYSVEELQQEAFSFVQYCNDPKFSDPTTLVGEEQEIFDERWYTYLNITSGPYKRGDLPSNYKFDRRDLKEEKWQDIQVCEVLRGIVKSTKHLYLGSGRHLPLDRLLVHDLIKKMNDKEQLFRYAVKSLATFQPAAVLEGGNGFMDLPGQNDVDTGCAAQTREGVKEAGVVFVVLSKSLSEDRSSLKLLKESGTVKRAAAGEAKVVFIFNREPQSTYQHRKLDTEYEQNVRKVLEMNTRALWERSLQEANAKAKNEGYAHKSEAEIELIASNTLMQTIYPMLHSSYTLNWECAERHKHTSGDLSSSVRVFELSNVNWLLGVLETLNRQSLNNQLKHIAMTELPALRVKLSASLLDAKNAGSGLPEWLVQRAQRFLMSRRSQDKPIMLAADALSKSISMLGATSATSFHEQMMNAIVKYVDHDAEVKKFLEEARQHSDNQWKTMAGQLTRIQSARAAVHTRNNGTHPGCALLPMIFKSDARQVPFSFEPLEARLSAVLEAMLGAVLDLVIKQVDKLIENGAAAGAAAADEAARLASIDSFKESFVASEVIQPLQERFSLHFFIKANQRNMMLNEGKFNDYLQKLAAQLQSVALKTKILNKSSECTTLAEIKELIRDNREEVREEWRSKLAEDICAFVDKQLTILLKDLASSKKTNPYSVKKMLTAVLQHIVHTNNLQQNKELQRDLDNFIKQLKYKTDSLQSLWAQLDRPADPSELGEASARHVERRRQREQMTKQAKGMVKLHGGLKRTLTIVRLNGEDEHKSSTLSISSIDDLFVASNENEVDSMMASLRSNYSLDVFAIDQQTRRAASGLDLFSAAAKVAFDSEVLKEYARDPDSLGAQLTMEQHVDFAAKQLRALVASQLAYYYRTDEQAQKLSFLNEGVTAYVERISNISNGADPYRGDLLCLWALAQYLLCSFRVWIPGKGSVFIPFAKRSKPSSAFQLMLIADKPAGSPPAGHYKSSWFPLRRPWGTSKVSIGTSVETHTLPMTDDDRSARITDDEGPRMSLGIGEGFAKGELQPTPSAYSRKRRHDTA